MILEQCIRMSLHTKKTLKQVMVIKPTNVELDFLLERIPKGFMETNEIKEK